MKVIVIGGVAAGMTAAMKLRRMNKEASITVYEMGSDLSYSGCGMPYFLGDVVHPIDVLVARTKEEFEASNLTMHLNHQVVKLDVKHKKIWIKDLKADQIITDTYDKLIIGVGTKANRLHIDGAALDNVFVLNQLSDARMIKKYIKKSQKVGIIGGGYIGVELADNLIEKGLKVFMFQRGDQVLKLYDQALGKKALDILTDMGVDVHFNEKIKSYTKIENITYINTDKKSYEVDFIVEAIGVKPNTDFLKDSSIKLSSHGAIIVNKHMQTSDPDVYAAGDCVLYPHLLLNKSVFMPLGTHANKSGRIVAKHIANDDVLFNGIVGSNVIKVGAYTFAKTGLSIKEAIENKLDYKYVEINANHITGFYPGATNIYVRLVYDPKTGVIKGAQLYGKKGVSNRINIMALAITKGLTAQEFSQLDLAYAPPFSPVWDPLLVASNQIKV